MELIFSDKFFYKIILLKNIDKNNIYHNIYNKGRRVTNARRRGFT